MSFRGQSCESQAHSLSRLIGPRQVAVDFDSAVVLREPETDRPISLNGGNGVKAKPALRNIRDAARVIRLDIDIDEPFHRCPWSPASFWPFHRQHH